MLLRDGFQPSSFAVGFQKLQASSKLHGGVKEQGNAYRYAQAFGCQSSSRSIKRY
ncbi:hypothetical protein Hanom_Chr17g01575091 [Helianthus anomalus]